ncbi:MAG: hypothetical protein ABIQ30_14980 [Devosia sp.]
MTFRLIEPHETFRTYNAPTVQIECVRCKRNAPDVDVHNLRQRFGEGLPIVAIAKQVAAAARENPCGLALMGSGQQCSVRAFEPPVWHWANLYQALHGHWHAIMHCNRRHEGLKRGKPCAEPIELDIPTLSAALGHDFKLAKLNSRCECPSCHTRSFEIEWIVPDPTPAPYSPAAEPMLKFRPTRAQVARGRLGVVKE